MLATNAEVKHSNQGAVVPGFGKVCSTDEDAIANIFGFSDLKKRHWITNGSDKEDPFVVHQENETVKFECSQGLHQHKASKDCKKDTQVKARKEGTSNLTSTVTGNRK